MRSLGLYCLLEGIPRPEGQVAALRAGLVWRNPQTGSAATEEAAEEAAEEATEEAAIRVAAARALCDWALVRCAKHCKCSAYVGRISLFSIQ